MPENFSKLENFQLRDLHPNISIGTASDRYAGWIGQIYSEDRYAGRITRRTKKVGGKTFVEKVLPVDSVKEYFQHFRVLELDFTFYRPLLDKNGKPTPNYHILRNYSKYLNRNDRLILKVPQIISAIKLHRGKAYVENEQYLNPDVFVSQFYEPAKNLLNPWLGGFIFEQEYQRKQDRIPAERFAAQLDAFFNAIPEDTRYHMELRTADLLSPPVIHVMEQHGIGQVLSNWTWLPPLTRQFALSKRKITNADKNTIIRLMTPLGVRYADAYARAHPFKTTIVGMLDEDLAKENVALMHEIVNEGAQINVIINNRYGGNAPLIAQYLAKQFIQNSSFQ